jgi:outer membrane protein assembly factor BamB
MDRKMKKVDPALEVHRKTPRMTFARSARVKLCPPWFLAGSATSALLAFCLLFPPAIPAEDADSADQKAAADKDPKEDPGAKTKGEKESEKEGEKEKRETKSSRSPLTDAIKRLSGKGAGPNVPPPPAGAEAAAPARSRRSTIDRAPSDQRSEDWMRKVHAHVRAGEWDRALEILQKVSDLPEDTLYRNEAGKWVSLHDEAARLRGEAPSEFLNQYRAQFGGLARQLLIEAVRAGDLAALGRVARTYFHTDAGYEAANRLGSLHLDRGEFALAAHWFAALWEARTPVTKDPLWRTKAAYALKQVGQTELSREILEGPEGPSAHSIGLGGRSYEPDKWLAAATSLSGPTQEALSDWPVFYGTPRRTGIAAGGEPLLLARWRIPTTESAGVRTQIEHLVEDLSDQGSPVLPLLFPTMVGGKVAFRTLHGVQVVDAESGRPLWQTDESQPLEKLIAGAAESDEAAASFLPGIAMGGRQVMMRQWNMVYNGGGGENSALCHLLFRNANFGLISSDGQQLFVVDDPEFFTNRQPDNPGVFGPDANDLAATGCKLTAYDLETGHPRWEIGGPANGEPFDLSLAGYFFFGAPVADEGELFVVGESTTGETAGQIRLVCLDPQTGRRKWSQLVASSDAGIEKDVRRRWWTAQVAVGDGILVCPTTAGWLVAVDRATHSILWGYRSSPQGPRQSPDNEAARFVQYASLGGVWGPAPPVISQGRIIYTPPETQTLVCLDQFTGKELWTKPRGHAWYLCGVFDKQVVVAARDSLTAYRLENGEQAWTTKIPGPAGRGVTVAERLYLPLAGGEVWSVDLKNGKVVNRWGLPEKGGSVGNLAMYRGMLLSVDALGLTAFGQRASIENEIDRRKRDDPRDPWALLHEAEIRLLEHDLDSAMAALRLVRHDDLPADLKEPFRRQLVAALTATIRKDLSRPETDADLRELEAAVRTNDEEQALRRLQAELFVARKEYVRAFDAYLALARTPTSVFSRDDAPAVRVRSDLWVAGKLADLRESLPEQTREAVDRRIAELRALALESEDASHEFLVLFRDHPEAVRVRRSLAEKYVARGEFLPAERMLSQLARGEGPPAAEALERLARLMLEFHLPADAAWYYRELETRLGGAILPGGATGAQFVKALRESGKFPDAPLPVLDWHADSLRVERMGPVYSNYVPQDLAPGGSAAPFFAKHRFEIEPSAQRLEVIDGLTDDLHWSLPLRGRAGAPEGGFALAQASGHHLTLLYRGVLHCLSPVDRKILWTRTLESRAAAQNLYGRPPMPLQPMQQAAALAKSWHAALSSIPGMPAALSLASEEFVGYQGRRSATLLDAISGETCWTCAGIRPGTLMLGGDQVVYFKGHEGAPLALRASDGKRLEVEKLPDLLSHAIHAVGDNFVLSNSSGGKTGMRLHDPVRRRDLWSLELSKGSLLSILENDRMAMFESDGKFSLVDLRTGQQKLLATLPEDERKGHSDVYVLADNASIYLIVNKGANQNYYSEQVPFVRASGLVFAFDIESGKQRWKQPVRAQNLMLERLAFSPYLVFSSRRYESKGKLHFWSLHLLAIDKISGARLLDEKSPAQPGFRSITVSAADRYVELRSYNERVRLYPEDKPASAGQSGGQ